MKRRFFLTILFALVFLFPGLAAAQSVDDADEGFIFRANGDVTVAQDEELGGVIVASGDAIVHGTVTGTLWVISGNATVDGTVDGDVMVIDGTLHLADGAVVDNVTLVRGTLDRAAGATITGDLTEQDDFVSFGWGAAVFTATMWLGVTVVLMLAALVFAYLGGLSLTGTGEVLRERWPMSIVTGLTLFIGLPILAVMAFFTIIGIPLGVAILLVVMPALWVLGYLIVGTGLGRMLVHALGRADRPERPLLAAALGVLVLQLVGLIPAIGPAVAIVAGIVGAGALVYRIVGRPRARARTPVVTGEPKPVAS